MITTNGVICFYEVLGNIYQVLKDHGFFFIHKSDTLPYDIVTIKDSIESFRGKINGF